MKRLLPFILSLAGLAAQAQQPARLDSLLRVANEQYEQKNHPASIRPDEAALPQPRIRRRQRVTAYYNMACDYALDGDAARAHRALRQALRAGWTDAAHLTQDSGLNLLPGSAKWDRAVAQARRGYEQFLATQQL